MAYVYIHKRKSDGIIFYVGIAKSDTDNYRAYEAYNRNILWKRIEEKHGRIVEIHKSNITLDEARKIEIDLIKQYGRFNNKTGILCNMTDGGEGCLGRAVSEEYKQILRERMTGRRFVFSEAAKRAFKEAGERRRGKPNKNKGMKHTPETKLKQSIAAKNRTKNRAKSQETKDKIREIVLKQDKVHIWAWKDGEIVDVFNRYSKCAESIGISKDCVLYSLKKGRETKGGFSFTKIKTNIFKNVPIDDSFEYVDYNKPELQEYLTKHYEQ